MIKPSLLVVGGQGDIARWFRAKLGRAAVYAGRSGDGLDYRIDLTDEAQCWAEPLRGVTHCLIAAGISKPAECEADRSHSELVNVTGTSRLLMECRSRGVVPIFLSSVQVYGSRAGVFVEGSCGFGLSVYAQQKKLVEDLIHANFSKYLILRISRVEYQTPCKSSLLSDIAHKLQCGNSKVAYDQLISLLLIDDLFKVVRQLVSSGRSGTYNVAGLEWCSRSLLAALVLVRLRKLGFTGLPDRISPLPMAHCVVGPVTNGTSFVDCSLLTRDVPSFAPEGIINIVEKFQFEEVDVI
jgi:dTDP-4-dehydrorhamnose reductase